MWNDQAKLEEFIQDYLFPSSVLSWAKNVKRALYKPTYSTTVAINCNNGEHHTITATNATNFTINAPTNPPSSAQAADLTIEVYNDTAAALGTITWNAAYEFNGFTYVSPGAGLRSFARFHWNGLHWICNSVSTVAYS